MALNTYCASQGPLAPVRSSRAPCHRGSGGLVRILRGLPALIRDRILDFEEQCEEALAEMRVKHPQEDEAVLPAEENSTPTLFILLRQVYEAVTSFKAGSAAGPSGLRGEQQLKGRTW